MSPSSLFSRHDLRLQNDLRLGLPVALLSSKEGFLFGLLGRLSRPSWTNYQEMLGNPTCFLVPSPPFAQERNLPPFWTLEETWPSWEAEKNLSPNTFLHQDFLEKAKGRHTPQEKRTVFFQKAIHLATMTNTTPLVIGSFFSLEQKTLLQKEQILYGDLNSEKVALPAPFPLHLIEKTSLPTLFGKAQMFSFLDQDSQTTHSAIIFGKPSLEEPPIVRVHSSCRTGDVFHSTRCDCYSQLQKAFKKISQHPNGGILLYLEQEGRQIGLLNKTRAYQLQDKGMDTYQANRFLGFKKDERSYEIVAHMLAYLGIRAIHLLSNNPQKKRDLEAVGITIKKVSPLLGEKTPHNERYLQEKNTLGDHTFLQSLLEESSSEKTTPPPSSLHK